MISGRLLAAYRSVVGSYAFVPGLLITGGVVLAVCFAAADSAYGSAWMGELTGVLGPSTGDGARSILSTIGGSMLSVAGIVFSVTLAAIVFASGQYGPHVLPQYRNDRLAQVTLGVMLGVFTYCMTALFAVQEGDETIVPRLTVFGALALAAVGIGMLITFINHMLIMLHVSNVIGRIGDQANKLIEHDLPVAKRAGDDGQPVQSPVVNHDTALLTRDGDALMRASGKGYVLTVGTQKLVEIARRCDLRMDLLVRPGDYVTSLTPILRVRPALPEEETEAMRAAFAYGRRRTLDEDAAFTLDELCAIGLRALSPGINDPFTATDVINQMTGVVERASRGTPLDAIYRDEAGEARVRRPVLTFDDVVRLTFDRMGTDAASNVTITPVVIGAYDSLLTNMRPCPEEERLRESLIRFSDLCKEGLPTELSKKEAARLIRRVLDRSRSDKSDGALRVMRLKRESVA